MSKIWKWSKTFLYHRIRNWVTENRQTDDSGKCFRRSVPCLPAYLNPRDDYSLQDSESRNHLLFPRIEVRVKKFHRFNSSSAHQKEVRYTTVSPDNFKSEVSMDLKAEIPGFESALRPPDSTQYRRALILSGIMDDLMVTSNFSDFIENP